MQLPPNQVPIVPDGVMQLHSQPCQLLGAQVRQVAPMEHLMPVQVCILQEHRREAQQRQQPARDNVRYC